MNDIVEKHWFKRSDRWIKFFEEPDYKDTLCTFSANDDESRNARESMKRQQEQKFWKKMAATVELSDSPYRSNLDGMTVRVVHTDSSTQPAGP